MLELDAREAAARVARGVLAGVTEIRGGVTRARGGGGRSTFLRDAAKARKGGRIQKQPRGTVSFMPKEGKGAGGAQKRDRSKGAARTRLAERKAKRRVEV